MQKRVCEVQDIVELNVRGDTNGFMVSRKLLCSVQGSALEAMFSGRHALPKIDGKIFVDRDPTIFRCIINYLSNNLRLQKISDEEKLDLAEMELEFWGLNQEEAPCSLSETGRKIQTIFNDEPPSPASSILSEQWKKSDPFSL